ncbi:MAG: ParA-like protein [Phage 64_12]|nr:MAG: ParA-like protein [Phage 64_12]
MKVVAITMQKGGVGKSTLTRSLAVAASEDGFNALALDMDAQQSTSQWSYRREEGSLPAVAFSTERDLPRHLDRARAAGCDLVIIDTPPARSQEGPAAMERADLVLIPCTPTIESFEQFPITAQVAKRAPAEAFGVLMMAAPNGRSDAQAADAVFAKSNVQMAPAVISRRKAHEVASCAGKTVQEIGTDAKAVAEMNALWAWLKGKLDLGVKVSKRGS